MNCRRQFFGYRVLQGHCGCNGPQHWSSKTSFSILEESYLGIIYHTVQVSFQGEGHSSYVSGIVAVRSQELLTCSYDRTVRLWDTRTR